MKRSAITNHDNDNNNKLLITTSTIDEINNHQHKRSLEDYGFLKNIKRRRHLSPQNANIDLNNANDSRSLSPMKKKTRTKSKHQSILNSSIDSNNEHNSINETSRKISSRYTSSSLSSQQMNEINLPNWERMCPNIDKILSNKHTQSGVFAHEVQLVQQELEALLSMAIVRENILKDLSKISINHSDTIRSKIRKHQEAERIYSTKKLSKKSLSSLIHQNQQQRQTTSNLILDRQVTITPILDARIDRIWSDINTYHHKISSNDILMIENLVEFNHHFKTKLNELKIQYNNQQIQQSNIIEQLNEENFFQLNQIADINPIITHYIDRTTIGLFQSKLYEHIGQTSPVYKTPISSPMHGRISSNNNNNSNFESTLRISPRLHSNHKIGLFSLPNLKYDEELEVFPASSSSAIKSKKKTKFLSSPSSAVKFQQRLEYVQNYLIDQHPSTTNETVKRQLFNELKSTKKRKSSTTTIHNIDQCSDIFQSKLSTLISLIDECSIISSLALKRVHLQSDNEQIWQKLNLIEHDLESSIEKLDTNTNDNQNSLITEKTFQNLAQLLNDWNKYEEKYDQQLDELFHLYQ